MVFFLLLELLEVLLTLLLLDLEQPIQPVDLTGKIPRIQFVQIDIIDQLLLFVIPTIEQLVVFLAEHVVFDEFVVELAFQISPFTKLCLTCSLGIPLEVSNIVLLHINEIIVAHLLQIKLPNRHILLKPILQLRQLRNRSFFQKQCDQFFVQNCYYFFELFAILAALTLRLLPFIQFDPNRLYLPNNFRVDILEALE